MCAYACIHIYIYIHIYIVYIYIYIYILVHIYYILNSNKVKMNNGDGTYAIFWRPSMCGTPGFHNFNLRTFNLRVSNPNK